jgi:hypothetical protein
MPLKSNNDNNSTQLKRQARFRQQARRSRVPDNFFELEERVQRVSPLEKQVIRQTKLVEKTNIVSSTTTGTFPSLVFRFSDLSDATELGSVFDQYRIDRVDVKILPNITEAISSTALLGRNYSVIDLDDSNAFTSITDPLDYSSSQSWGVMDPIQLSLVPHLAMAAYSGVFTSFANSGPRWIDAASPGVEHYGVKLAIGSTTTAVTYTVTCRYHISLRFTH